MIRIVICLGFMAILCGCQKPPQDSAGAPDVKVEVTKGQDGHEETKSSLVDP